MPAAELLKKSVINPSNRERLPVLPGFFVEADVGTGVVMSVPAHAPFDYAALAEAEGLRRKRADRWRSVIKIERPGSARQGRRQRRRSSSRGRRTRRRLRRPTWSCSSRTTTSSDAALEARDKAGLQGGVEVGRHVLRQILGKEGDGGEGADKGRPALGGRLIRRCTS